MFATTKLRGDALTAVFTDTTELPPHRVGQFFQTAEGNIHRFVQVHDPNTIGMSQYDALVYEAGAASDGLVTPELAEGAAGLFAGANQADTAVTDDDYIFIQTRGLGTIAFEPTADTAIDAGDGIVVDQNGVTDRQVAASNDLAGKAAESLSGLTSGVKVTVEAYIQGVM